MTVTGEQVRALRLSRHHLDRPLPSGALVEADIVETRTYDLVALA